MLCGVQYSTVRERLCNVLVLHSIILNPRGSLLSRCRKAPPSSEPRSRHHTPDPWSLPSRRQCPLSLSIVATNPSQPAQTSRAHRIGDGRCAQAGPGPSGSSERELLSARQQNRCGGDRGLSPGMTSGHKTCRMLWLFAGWKHLCARQLCGRRRTFAVAR